MPENTLQKTTASLGGAAQMAVHILLPFLHAGRTRWGATGEELARTWPGDELVASPRGGFTHAITIQAPAAEVYRWAAQIGQDKAGFYSYELLENIAGCKMNNAYRLVDEWQKIAPGSQLRMHPSAAVPVLQIWPGQGYLIGGFIDAATGKGLEPTDPRPPRIIAITWLFYAVDQPGGGCRFISRWRLDYPPTFINQLTMGKWIFEPIAHVMDVRMLQTIKKCAEGELAD